MLQSLEDGTLAFLHRSTHGPKAGDASEKNPLKRFWPDYITSPITGDVALQVLTWDQADSKMRIQKAAFQEHIFQCTSVQHTLRTKCPFGNNLTALSGFDENLNLVTTCLEVLRDLIDDVLEEEAVFHL